MDVELAEERILVLADRFNLDHAEGRAWAKRADAFGAVAKLGGLLNRAGSEDYECVYRERRLQPFWRLHSRSVAEYERTRSYAVPVAPEVRSVAADAAQCNSVNTVQTEIGGPDVYFGGPRGNGEQGCVVGSRTRICLFLSRLRAELRRKRRLDAGSRLAPGPRSFHTEI